MRKLEHILETFPLSSLRRIPEAIYFFLEGKKKGCKSQSSTCIAHRVTVLPTTVLSPGVSCSQRGTFQSI